MLDSAGSRNSVVHDQQLRSVALEPWREGIGFWVFLRRLRHLRRAILVSMFVGAASGLFAGVVYTLARTPAFSAASELLISNTTLQLSGPDAVVTQILVENSLIESAIEMLKSTSVLGRVIDKIGLDNIERMLPKSGAIHVPWPRENTSAPKQDHPESSQWQNAIEALRSNTTAKRVGASQLILVRGRSLTAQDAARLTNELAEAFVEEQNTTNAVVTTSAALRERIKVLGPTARIVSEAFPPGSKDGPAAVVAQLIATVLGGALGVAGGLVFALFDRRVRSAEQLAALLSVECLGYLPRVKRQPNGRDVEMLAALKRSVLRRARSAVLERSGRVPHVVAVTSCYCAEGKTTLAANLARFVAREDSRVLLIDGSREVEALSSEPDETTMRGLHELLRGEVSPDQVILGEISPNVDLLPSGDALDNHDAPWANLVTVLNGGRECFYEWIILDLPALASAADVQSAGQIVDDLLIVVEWGRTSEAQLERALQALGPLRDRVVGTVINKTPWGSLNSEALIRMRRARSSPLDVDLHDIDQEGLL